MTEEEFFQKVWNHQKECKQLSEGDGGYNIKRGMAKVSSGYIEDLFALYLAKKNKTDYLYLIDKITSLKFSKNGKSTTFKPDLSVISSNNILFEYFDIKTNLGWNRDINDYMKKKNDFISKIKGRKGWIRFSQDEILNIEFDHKLKYKMVVIHGGNINESQIEANKKCIEQYDNVELYILYDHYKNRINTEDFERLITDSIVEN